MCKTLKSEKVDVTGSGSVWFASVTTRDGVVHDLNPIGAYESHARAEAAARDFVKQWRAEHRNDLHPRATTSSARGGYTVVVRRFLYRRAWRWELRKNGRVVRHGETRTKKAALAEAKQAALRHMSAPACATCGGFGWVYPRDRAHSGDTVPCPRCNAERDSMPAHVQAFLDADEPVPSGIWPYKSEKESLAFTRYLEWSTHFHFTGQDAEGLHFERDGGEWVVGVVYNGSVAATFTRDGQLESAFWLTLPLAQNNDKLAERYFPAL